MNGNDRVLRNRRSACRFAGVGSLLLGFLVQASAAQALFTLEELELALSRELTNKPLLMEVVRRYHKLLLDEPDDRTWKSATRYFDLLDRAHRLYQVREGRRVDALALAYYSSYSVLRNDRLERKGAKMARRFAGPFLKRQAFANLDLAVKMEPEDLEIRLVRAYNGYALEGKSRMLQSIEDLRYVLLTCEREPRKGRGLDLPELYFLCGRCAKRDGDYILAFKAWTGLVEKYPDSDQAEQAKALLEELKPKTKGQPGAASGEGEAPKK